MKRILKNKILICSTLLVAVAAMSVSCSDWTSDESLDIKINHIGNKNSELYQQYLANLRNYKNTEHKVLIGWFDNGIKAPFSKGSHLDILPDSVDIVSLMYPDNLTDWEISEINTIRKDKGTKVIYTIDCDAMTSDYNAIVLQNELDGVETTQTLYQYLYAGIDAVTGLIDKYSYDGVQFTYSGISSDFLSPAEQAQESATQDMVFGKLNVVINANPGKLFIYQGAPLNIINKSYLEPMKYIILDTSLQSGPGRVELQMEDLLCSPDVPTDRIVVTARSLSSTNEKVGYYSSEEGGQQSAVVVLSKWVAEPHRYGKSGLGVLYINDGYYNMTLEYKDVREAISIMNPSPNN